MHTKDTHLHSPTYIQYHIYTHNLCLCIYTYIHICTRTDMSLSFIATHTCISLTHTTNIHTQTHTHNHTYINTVTHTHTHENTHRNTRTHILSGDFPSFVIWIIDLHVKSFLGLHGNIDFQWCYQVTKLS